MIQAKRIELKEYQPTRLDRQLISNDVGEQLWRSYGKHVAIEFPSPKTDGQWQLTSQGWVGYIPITKELGLSLMPKVPLMNLFRMLEYAFRLKSFYFLEGITQCDTLQDFYERIAHILALRVLERGKKGLYREYIEQEDQLSYVRGKLNIAKSMRRPWDSNLHCCYQEHTADIEDNQTLYWTLYRITRSGLCGDLVLSSVHKAMRILEGKARLTPFCSKDCIKRLYHRLNQDYQPMHALCRFFLDQSGPSYAVGDYMMLPFLVDMARLFELFIAEWLKIHLPSRYEVRSQESFQIGEDGGVSFTIDLVLYDTEEDTVKCVLDTKYKVSEYPLPGDVAQVVTYAVAKKCTEAILIYPTDAIHSYDEYIGDIRVRSLGVSLNGDLEENGRLLMEQILSK